MTHDPRCRQSPDGQVFDTLTIAAIRCRLAAWRPEPCPPGSRKTAAVALILREGAAGPEVLFIERARHDDDPWSGDIGFPGGKVEREDAGARQAAEREALEEVGIELAAAEYIGHLCDLTGDHLPIFISCFVYALPASSAFVLSSEVTDAFWFPLRDLFDSTRHSPATVHFRGVPLVRPAIDLLGPGRTVLWGITYRLITRFAAALGVAPHLTPGPLDI
jgi:8-oxo-dGTP pyrophosphatase MutT (NUDIX family)